MSQKSGTNPGIRRSMSNPPKPNDFYNLRNLTRFGRATIPGYSMVPAKVKFRQRDVQPGPADYYPETYGATGRRGPAFSLAGRLRLPSNDRSDLPAPNHYQRISVSHDRDKMVGKTFGLLLERKTKASDAPFYPAANPDSYKRRAPTFRMVKPVGRPPPTYAGSPDTPGPNDYYPKLAGGPAFSFGRKYSAYVRTMRTDSEYEPV